MNNITYTFEGLILIRKFYGEVRIEELKHSQNLHWLVVPENLFQNII